MQNTGNRMSLKHAMKVLEQLDTSPANLKDIEDAINTVIHSDDIAHMSRKGLYNTICVLVDNIRYCRIIDIED